MPKCDNCGSENCCYEIGLETGDENAYIEIRAALADRCWEGCQPLVHHQCDLLNEIAHQFTHEFAMRWTREAAHAAVMETTRRLATDMPPDIRAAAARWAEGVVEDFDRMVGRIGYARTIAYGHVLGQEIADFVDDDYFDDRVLDEPNCLFCGKHNSHWEDLLRRQ